MLGFYAILHIPIMMILVQVTRLMNTRLDEHQESMSFLGALISLMKQHNISK